MYVIIYKYTCVYNCNCVAISYDVSSLLRNTDLLNLRRSTMLYAKGVIRPSFVNELKCPGFTGNVKQCFNGRDLLYFIIKCYNGSCCRIFCRQQKQE